MKDKNTTMPRGWKIHSAGTLCSLVTKGTTPKWSNGPQTDPVIPFLRVQNLQFSGRIKVEEDTIFIDSKTHTKELARSRVYPNDVLINIVGPPLGKIGLVTNQFPEWNINQAIALFRPGNGLEPTYLSQYLLSSRAQSWLMSQAKKTSGQQNLTLETCSELPILTPTLPEQRKIAKILNTWDEALEKLDALVAAQEQRKRGLMQTLLTGQERVMKSKGNSWVKVRLGQVLERVFRPIQWSPDLALSLISLRRRCGGLFRRPDVLASEYKTQDLHELRDNDFLISKRQVAHGAWGIVPREFSGSHVSKEYAILVNTAPTQLHMPFFAWLAQMPRMIRLARVASTGVHIEKLIFDPDVFLREVIRIPESLEEQRKIANILYQADHELMLLKLQRDALNGQKRGLMQLLLTGKVRVKT